jgi:hypothetical protein
LEDQKRTGLHKSRFGADVIQYVGLLILGRSRFLDEAQQERLVWRSEQVHVGARKVNCFTFEDLHAMLASKLDLFGHR